MTSRPLAPDGPDDASGEAGDGAATGADLRPEARIERLLDAVLAISGDLDLEAMLGRVVSAACALVDAKFGALGVIDEDGDALSAFVHHGFDAPTVRRIGTLPEGRGILGLLIDQPAPLRLDDLQSHPLSFGFPPGHPPMHAFLGAPIRVRDQVFGNLYLTEKQDGSTFTAEDEALVVGLASVAGSAIANARLYDDARRREAWRSAVIEVSDAVLAARPMDWVRGRVAELGASLVDADAACLVEPRDDGLWVLATVQDAPDEGPLAAGGGPVWDAISEGRPVRVEHGPIFGGPTLWVPVREDTTVVAALGVGRPEPFTAREEQLLTEFCSQVSFAWSFERAQQTLQRLSLVEDRERIGRDLHDTVIQRLFATGLSLQATIRRCDDLPDVVERLERAVDDIDETVREIRTTIFALQSPDVGGDGVRSRVLAVVDEVGRFLPARPRVRFDGPIDTVVTDDVSRHLVPVVREALTNVGKHARATTVSLELAVSMGAVRLTVTDDGVGMPEHPQAGFGLGNLHERARALGGALEIRPGTDGRGTVLQWSLPAR